MLKIEPAARTETEALFQDLDKPSLHGLSYALRHPDTWPEDFVWNYKNCSGCAIGLAHGLWVSLGQLPNPQSGFEGHRGIVTKMAKTFSLPFSESRAIFFDEKTVEKIVQRRRFLGLGPQRETVVTQHINYTDVTPENVADQIDAYLARAE